MKRQTDQKQLVQLQCVQVNVIESKWCGLQLRHDGCLSNTMCLLHATVTSSSNSKEDSEEP